MDYYLPDNLLFRINLNKTDCGVFYKRDNNIYLCTLN
jgi:hypothetical protein